MIDWAAVITNLTPMILDWTKMDWTKIGWTEVLKVFIPTVVGGVGAFWGIFTYREGQKLKRREIQ